MSNGSFGFAIFEKYRKEEIGITVTLKPTASRLVFTCDARVQFGPVVEPAQYIVREIGFATPLVSTRLCAVASCGESETAFAACVKPGMPGVRYWLHGARA